MLAAVFVRGPRPWGDFRPTSRKVRSAGASVTRAWRVTVGCRLSFRSVPSESAPRSPGCRASSSRGPQPSPPPTRSTGRPTRRRGSGRPSLHSRPFESNAQKRTPRHLLRRFLLHFLVRSNQFGSRTHAIVSVQVRRRRQCPHLLRLGELLLQVTHRHAPGAQTRQRPGLALLFSAGPGAAAAASRRPKPQERRATGRDSPGPNLPRPPWPPASAWHALVPSCPHAPVLRASAEQQHRGGKGQGFNVCLPT